MVGWHHRLNGHELGQTLGDSEGQGGLACYRPWGRKKSDMTQQHQETGSGKSEALAFSRVLLA